MTAAIKMEVCRNMGPEDNFLQKVRQLATERNIILIFDECTSGFRQTFGGLYAKYMGWSRTWPFTVKHWEMDMPLPLSWERQKLWKLPENIATVHFGR